MTDAITTGVAVCLLLIAGLYWLFPGMPARVFKIVWAAQAAQDVEMKPSFPPEAPALDTTAKCSAKLPSPPRLPTLRPPPLRAPDAEEPDSGRTTDLLQHRAEGIVYNIGELDPKRDDEGPVSPPRVVGRVITTPPPPRLTPTPERG